ncbi:tubulin--tyrosine ligase-like protein 12 isoform X2 [Palaemon carinicauda]|uniref:tubulin--tyrosine ligase-like protein 12 isoform X2 n=1 Tax=Palaemon carinicauda TaxID=392227 RepID=UPI0035B650FD
MTELNGLSKSFVEQHKVQLESSGVPPHFWPTIFKKLQGQIYDAGEYFQLIQPSSTDDGEDSGQSWWVVVFKEDGLKARDPNNIFLIDHCWTYRAEEARSYLVDVPGLLERMMALMDIPSDENTRDEQIEKVLKEMWKFNMTYTLMGKTAEESLPVWYIMDEFGSRIQHCGEPNFRVVPFYYTPHHCSYSLLFPIEYGRINETLPDPYLEVKDLPTDREIRVYADYEYVCKYLTDPRFVFTDCQQDADILWLSEHFKDFRALRQNNPQCRVNQYPCEHLLTVKDLLAIVCYRTDKQEHNQEDLEVKNPAWFPVTYCLKRELAKFVSYFQRREKRGEDNHWIVKPWNLARGLDHTITNNLNHILRLPSTGPKIAQKYISDPVLFYRDDINADVKFDLRYIVMLLSVKPLKVAVYKRFWIRFANKPFDLSHLENSDKHFTVNNYNDAYLLQMYCHDFVEKFNSQYPDDMWDTIETKIYSMFFEVFKAATSQEAPKGIPHNTQSKGCFGFDVMVKWTEGEKRSMEPQLLEINFNSDCKRACEYYPEFFNDVFSVMFLDELEGHNVTVLQ